MSDATPRVAESASERYLQISSFIYNRRHNRLQGGGMKLPAVLLLVSTLLQGAAGQAKVDAVESALEHFESEWNAAHLRGDASTLDRLFADDIVVIVPGMRVLTKADALGVFKSGRMKFDRYETSETKVRMYGDAAVVTGRLVRTRVVAGTARNDDWRFTKVYMRRAGQWQVVSFHASDTGS